MRKTRKSRVHFASIRPYVSGSAVYYLVVPYDKKGKEIPSSVNCAYNGEYYTPDEALYLARSL